MSTPDIRSPVWDLNLIPDLTGKVALITGTSETTGIGWNVAHQIALKGAKVFFHARSQEKVQAAIDAVISASPSIPRSNLASFVADFADLKAVKAAAEKFAQSETRLDILVNNAGLLARGLDKDANGISVSMVVNHFAPFILTTTLLPLIKKTAASHTDVRVVNISSTTQTLVPVSVRFDSLEAFNNELGAPDGLPYNLFRYGLSKLANLLFTKALQKRFDDEGVNAIAVTLHPGGVTTPGALRFVVQLPGHEELIAKGLTPLQGATTPLFAATAPVVWKEKSKYGGAYLMPYGVISPDDESADAKNIDLAFELWETSDKIVADVLRK